MASPQIENGFTKISNELLEALTCAPLTGTQFAMIFCIIRKTYGFNKKSDKISISQFMSMIDISRRTVIYNLQDLESKKIIKIIRRQFSEKSEINEISLNKDYSIWVVQNSAPQVINNRGSAKLRKGVVQNRVKSLRGFAPTKETITKEITKETSEQGSHDRIKSMSNENLIPEVIKLFEAVDPKNKNYYSNKTQRGACLFLLQEYGLEQIQKRTIVLPKTNGMPFFPNITTPCQLRDKWVQLDNQVKRYKTEALTKSNSVAF